MKNNKYQLMKKIISALLVGIFLVSCGTQKNVSKPTDPIDVKSPILENKYFFDAISQKSAFENLKITSKINAEIGKIVPTIDATIYIENRQKIWMNMSTFFINVARGLATPEGLKLYEKMNKTYIDSDFEYLNKLLNVNFIDYHALQNLLVGKMFIPIQEKDFSLTQNTTGYILSSGKNQQVVVDGKTTEYKVEAHYSPELDLTKVTLQDTKTPDNFEIFYYNWELVGNHRLPKNVKIIIKGKKTDQILIENTKFDFSKMDTPYSVPNNYKKREI